MRGTLDVLEAIARRAIAELDQRHRPAARRGPFLRAGADARGGRLDAGRRTRPSGSIATRHGCARSRRTWTRGATSAREGRSPACTSPRLVTERAVAQLERLLALAPRGLARDRAARGATPRATERIADVVRDTVNPAFARYRETLRELPAPLHGDDRPLGAPGRRRALRDVGPRVDGAAARSRTTCTRSGSSGTRGSQDERAAIAGRLGYTSAADAIEAHQASGANTASSRDALLALAREQVERSWEASRAFFGRMPHANCDVRPVEEFREQDTPLGFYNPPTEDGSRRGAYYINTSDLHGPAAASHREPHVPRGEPGPSLPALDRAGAPRPARAPAVRRHPRQQRVRGRVGSVQRAPRRRDGLCTWTIGSGSACSRPRGCAPRGWSPTPGSTRWDGRASARSTRWRRSARRTSTRSIEVDRYIAIPGQALSYMIGMIEIERARRGRDRARGSGVLALRLPRPVARARPAAAPGAATRARLTGRNRPAGRAEA